MAKKARLIESRAQRDAKRLAEMRAKATSREPYSEPGDEASLSPNTEALISRDQHPAEEGNSLYDPIAQLKRNIAEGMNDPELDRKIIADEGISYDSVRDAVREGMASLRERR